MRRAGLGRRALSDAVALVPDAARRARLVARHGLDRGARDVVEVVRGLVAMHSSDPITPFLGSRARLPGFEVGDLERALYDERTLWRLHGMRRTLFVVASDEGPTVEAGAAFGVARTERRRLEAWIADSRPGESASTLLARAQEGVRSALAGAPELRTQELVALVPELATEIELGSGRWATTAPLGTRLLVVMAMEGLLVRGRAVGSWRSSQYRWSARASWFGEADPRPDPRAARALLARRYLESHGPATMRDLAWWTGWGTRAAATAARDAGVLQVRLEATDEPGLVLVDDVEDDAHPVAEERVSLLPGLDPTPMGWKRRDFYLGPHADVLFDRNGNVGPTIWLGGRVVGGWAQRTDGGIAFRLLEDVGKEASRRVAAEAATLEAWLGGTVTVPRFRTPLERELAA